MKRRPIFLLLAGLMTLSLAACGPAPSVGPDDPAGGQTTQTPEPDPGPSPTPEPSDAEPAVGADDVPTGEYAPWQTAYAGFLAEELRRDAVRAETEAWNVSDMYSLYDADEDGTPELFIQYGSCEADYHTVCYTFREGRVEALKDGDFGSGHGMVYTCPGEKAFLFSWGHMGYAEISKVPIENGGLGEWERLLEENTNASVNNGVARDYTHPSELVPGAQALPYYYIRTCRDHGGQDRPLTLPIYDYGALPRLLDAPVEEGEVRAAISAVLWEGAELYGVSGDGFYGDTGSVTLEEYLQPGGAYPYGDGPLSVGEYAWADVNGDGQTDCILHLERRTQDQVWNADHYAILSLQDGTVYAYFLGFTDGFGVDPDGSVYVREFSYWQQVSFYKNQCYDFSASHAPVEGADLAWDEYAPNP